MARARPRIARAAGAQVVASRWLTCSLLVLAALACSAPAPIERAPPRRAEVERDVAVPMTTVPPQAEMYSPEEALRDVMSGALEYLGTGRWPGIERSRSCVFRNQRVLVVNVYCSVTEAYAFRLDVYSPQRGRVRIYAESTGPISIRDRALYMTFTAESEAPPGPLLRAPPIALSMSLEQLQSYEQQRYDAFLPGCYGGVRHNEPIGGCLGPLAPHHDAWAAYNRAFLAHANADWYQVVRQMRELAKRHGEDPK
ncbi:MAG TPA: hypothetical protein VK509_01275 [Polyangiales bacterium]|nr:hypothetical protein [Polyangiales bacterium]